jgi:acyl-CoA thioesterase-1
MIPSNRFVLLFLVLFPMLFTNCMSGGGELRSGFEKGQYKVIVAFGDSIVEGYREPEGWPEILGRRLSMNYNDVQVVNAGVSGDTALDGLRRLRKSVLDKNPDLVLVSVGLNDMKNGRPVDAFARDLENIVDKIRQYGAEPVLLTTTRLQKGTSMVSRFRPEPYNDAVRRIASEKALPMIDIYKEFGGYNTARYLRDVAHPNLEGYRVLAKIIGKRLVGE